MNMNLLKEFIDRLSLLTIIYLSILALSLLTTNGLVWLAIVLTASMFYLIACRLLWTGFSKRYSEQLKQLDHLTGFEKINKEV